MTLRKGVLFHNDKELTSADAVASLKRWGQMSVRGQPIFARLDTIQADDKYTFTMNFKQSTGALLVYLSEGSSFIIPEDVANALPKEAMKTKEQIVGTGPFRFVEHLPDRHLKVQRWDKHISPEGPSSNMAGKRVAYVDEILFMPVPEGSVRADGVGTNEYHFAESLQPDQYDSVKAAISHEPVAKAAVGREDFYRLDPSLAAPETAWFTDEGKELFNKPDPDKAKRLMQEGGYDGTPIRWMSTKEYFYNYNGSLPIKQQLEAIGFKVDLQVIDWATLGKRRSDPKEYDVFVTAHSGFDHPIIQPFNAAGWPGWWVSERRDKVVSDMFAEADPQKAMALIRQLQALFYEEVPALKLVEYYQLQARRNELKGYDDRPDWFFWNAALG
jgi:peptide/nickel transport system substrate-binding protein